MESDKIKHSNKEDYKNEERGTAVGYFGKYKGITYELVSDK